MVIKNSDSFPQISVIMSVYNACEYLVEAIESILNQSFKAFEFIIINDGSTDRSLEILTNYAAQDSRIRLFTRENKGRVNSLNEALLFKTMALLFQPQRHKAHKERTKKKN